MLPDGITASIRVNKITIPLTTLNLQQIKTGNSIPPYTSCSHLRGLLYTMDCFVAQTVCPTWSAVNCQQRYLTQYLLHKPLSILTHKHAPNIAASSLHAAWHTTPTCTFMNPVMRGLVAQFGWAMMEQQICPHRGSKGWSLAEEVEAVPLEPTAPRMSVYVLQEPGDQNTKWNCYSTAIESWVESK